MLVADELGGVGLGLVECAIVHEELGRCLAPVPHIPSCVLAARLIALAGSGAQQAEWLPAIACGERIVVTAWQEPGNSADIAAVALAARRDGERIVLEGVKTLVPFANSADALLVIARLDGELAALFVPAHSAGMGLVDLPNHAEQKLMRVDFARVAVDPANRLDGAPFADAWRRAMHETLIALAAESIGGAQRMLEMADVPTRRSACSSGSRSALSRQSRITWRMPRPRSRARAGSSTRRPGLPTRGAPSRSSR